MRSIAPMRSLWILLVMTCVFSYTQVSFADVNIDDVLKQVTVYDYGASREPLTQLTEMIRDNLSSKSTISSYEQKMIGVLQGDATFAAKQFICKKLSIIGTEASVPTLAKLLKKAETADIALYALERIPGAAVDKALRKALGKAKGNVKIGIINTIGQRHDTEAVKSLTKLLKNKDAAIVSAAAAALGKIGTPTAATALEKAITSAPAEAKLVVLDGYLKCADNYLQKNDVASASSMYAKLYADQYPPAIQAAAFRGLAKTSGDKALALIQSTIDSKTGYIQSVAIALIRELPANTDITPLVSSWANLSDMAKIQLLTAFADRGDKAVRGTVVKATGDTSEDVRIAALKTLAVLGNDDDVMLLAKKAGTAYGNEKSVAQSSLARLRGEHVDETIIAEIPKAEAKVKTALIRSTEERNTQKAVKVLIPATSDENTRVRTEAWRSLKSLASPNTLESLVDILVKTEDPKDMKNAEQAVVAVAKRGDSAEASQLVMKKLKTTTKPESKGALIRVLGKLGADTSLATIQKSLKQRNQVVKEASIAALSDWPTTEPMDDLLTVVKKSKNDVHQILALRGFIGLIGKDKNRCPKETVALYVKAMKLATQVNEKRMVLSGLSNIGTLEALNTVKPYLKNESLKAEAEVAVVKIAGATVQNTVEQVKTDVEAVVKSSENRQVKRDGGRLLERLNK